MDAASPGGKDESLVANEQHDMHSNKKIIFSEYLKSQNKTLKLHMPRGRVPLNTPSKVPRTIPAVIKAMNATNEEQQVELYENLLASMFGTPILIFGSLANIVFRNLMWHEPYEDTLLASIMFMTLAILFQILTRLPIRIRFMTHIMSFLVAAGFFFIICDFYDYIGPAVLTIGYIQIMIANTRTNRIMLYYVSVGVFISGLYVWAFYRDMPLVLGDIYYGVQCGLFFLLFIFAYLVQQVNRNRLNRISKLMEEALQQKEDTMSLYEEIAATEEELRSQNEQLKAYNETIRKNEEKLNHLAYYDTLTELPNRKTIMERLQLLIHLNKRRHPIYVVFIDVDDFKRVNDTMGHYAGDTLIKKVSETLNDTVHPDDLVGRLGGDEFALIIHRPLDEEYVLQYIDEIRLHISEIQFMESYEIRTSASFGVSVYPHDGEEEIELMKSADTAMYKAKELGKNGIQFFRREMKEEIVQRIQMEKRLDDALSKTSHRYAKD